MSNLVPSLIPVQPIASEVFLLATGLQSRRFPVSAPHIAAFHIIWETAASNFTIRFFTSCLANPAQPAATIAPDLEQWFEETGIPFAPGVGVAVGSQVVHLGNNGARWFLIEITPVANSTISVFQNER
jgi:hypothetical protein